MKDGIHLGKWTEEKLNRLLMEASAISEAGARVDFLSGKFLKTPYKEATLIGDMNREEVFVVNLEGLDCFTYLDYVEAMRRSTTFSLFVENLKKVRYRSGRISFSERNHFFTDWTVSNADYIADVTKKIDDQKCKTVKKKLNEKEDGTYYLPGVTCRLRKVTFVPSRYVDENVMRKLETGDYIGIYSEKEGLDVSHVGIIIKEKGVINLRHASSQKKHREVIDEDFKDYVNNKPGIIILRTIESVHGSGTGSLVTVNN
jgi:hypothetical protein